MAEHVTGHWSHRVGCRCTRCWGLRSVSCKSLTKQGVPCSNRIPVSSSDLYCKEHADNPAPIPDTQYGRWLHSEGYRRRLDPGPLYEE